MLGPVSTCFGVALALILGLAVLSRRPAIMAGAGLLALVWILAGLDWAAYAGIEDVERRLMVTTTLGLLGALVISKWRGEAWAYVLLGSYAFALVWEFGHLIGGGAGHWLFFFVLNLAGALRFAAVATAAVLALAGNRSSFPETRPRDRDGRPHASPVRPRTQRRRCA